MFETLPIKGEVFLYGYGASLVLSAVLTFLLVKVFRGSNKIAVFVRSRVSIGREGVNLFGGVGVILSFLITLWSAYYFGGIPEQNIYLLQVVTVGVVAMLVLGIIDDIISASAKSKLAVQIIIAVLLYYAGFKIERIGDWLELGNFGFLLTALWIVGICNALNLIDGQDGLASGMIFLSCLTLVFVYLERQLFEASFLSVILAGSILGFFFFNFPPAKIILGDTGSLPLGLLISIIALLPLSQGYTDEIYYLIPVITLLVPITDTTFAFFRRLIKGVSPFSKDTEHFHHRLEKLNLSPVKSIFILFAVAFYFDLMSLIPVYHINIIPKLIPIFFVLVILHLAVLVYVLRRFEKK